jgi:hypothetical protein
MMATEAQEEELGIFVERLIHFMNFWTIYDDLLTHRYVPSLDLTAKSPNDSKEWPVGITVMLLLYAHFYSLVEDSDDGLNGFRVWRQIWPNEEPAISAVEARVTPFLDRLRLFRNRLGFHGSRTRSHEAKGLNLFAEHSGDEIYLAMKLFKALGAALLAMDTAVRSGDQREQARCRGWIDRTTAKARSGIQANGTSEGSRDEA